MTEDNHAVENKADELKGLAKEKLGKITGDKKTESEGLVEKTLSKAKEAFADAKDAIDGVASGVKNSKNSKDDENK